MGYLLPIQYTQYQEYQNRIKGLKSNYSRTVKVDRVKQVYLSQTKDTNLIARNKQLKQAEKGSEKVYADITGVGVKFDEFI